MPWGGLVLSFGLMLVGLYESRLHLIAVQKPNVRASAAYKGKILNGMSHLWRKYATTRDDLEVRQRGVAFGLSHP